VFIPVISPVQPYGPVAALCFLVAISAVREGVQDVKRHREDAEVNSSLCNRLRNGAYENARWCDLVVGDVIRLESGELVPADLAVLKASPNAQLCYVSTLGLDGETNAKVKRVPVLASRVSDELSGVIQSEEPSKDLSRFVGTLTIGSETVALENENVIYRGSRLVEGLLLLFLDF
jgi:phospholipid-transporting ATPase